MTQRQQLPGNFQLRVITLLIWMGWKLILWCDLRLDWRENFLAFACLQPLALMLLKHTASMLLFYYLAKVECCIAMVPWQKVEEGSVDIHSHSSARIKYLPFPFSSLLKKGMYFFYFCSTSPSVKALCSALSSILSWFLVLSILHWYLSSSAEYFGYPESFVFVPSFTFLDQITPVWGKTLLAQIWAMLWNEQCWK